jgi:hypothetical protein
MAEANVPITEGNKADADAATSVGGRLRPRPGLRKTSSSGLKNLFRSLSKGEDADSAPPKNLETTSEVPSQKSESIGLQVSRLCGFDE